MAGISSSKSSRKRTRDGHETDTLNALSRIADKICNESVPSALPPSPTIDNIDNFMAGIRHQIRMLASEIHFNVIMEIMELVRRKGRQ